MFVYHIVLNDDELENVKKWAEELRMTIEDYIQGMIDEMMEAQLEFERGKQ